MIDGYRPNLLIGFDKDPARVKPWETKKWVVLIEESNPTLEYLEYSLKYYVSSF